MQYLEKILDIQEYCPLIQEEINFLFYLENINKEESHLNKTVFDIFG